MSIPDIYMSCMMFMSFIVRRQVSWTDYLNWIINVRAPSALGPDCWAKLHSKSGCLMTGIFRHNSTHFHVLSKVSFWWRMPALIYEPNMSSVEIFHLVWSELVLSHCTCAHTAGKTSPPAVTSKYESWPWGSSVRGKTEKHRTVGCWFLALIVQKPETAPFPFKVDFLLKSNFQSSITKGRHLKVILIHENTIVSVSSRLQAIHCYSLSV